MRRITRMPHNVLKSVNIRLPSSYTRYRLQPHSLPRENPNPITVRRPRRGVQLENGNRHRNLSKNIWKPQAYSLPRIIIFLQMLTGLILLALVIAGCISNDPINYSFYLVQFTYVSPNGYNIPPTSCPRTTCGIEGFTLIPQCTSLVIRVSYFGMCLSDNVTPVRCSTDIWNFATGAQGVDPLMVAETAKSLIESVVSPYLLLLVITLGLTSLIMTMVLFLPVIFNWRHARNLHFLCIVMAGAVSFFLFVEILITKMGILGGMYGVTTTSLTTVSAQKGTLSEALLWTAWAIWGGAFLLVWWVRWWEILERREKKKAAKKAEEDKKKKSDQDKKAAEALKNKPMKPEDAVLQQMAAAQM